jgi:hypothetical protein
MCCFFLAMECMVFRRESFDFFGSLIQFRLGERLACQSTAFPYSDGAPMAR